MANAKTTPMQKKAKAATKTTLPIRKVSKK